MIDLSPLKTDIASKAIAVLGLGASGLAVVRACKRALIPCHAWDDNPAARAQAAASGARTDPLTEKVLSGCALLCPAPGIPLTHPAPHPTIAAARAAGVEIVGDIELFHRARPDALTMGITGTNGKSTTTALAGHLLKEAGRPVAVGGNIGTPVFDLPHLDQNDAVYVLELSSFQLDLCTDFAPTVSLLVNISPDHLDRHGDLAGYVAAKERIFRPAKAANGVSPAAIVGVDDDESAALFNRLSSSGGRRLVPVSVTRPLDESICVTSDGMLCEATRPVASLSACPALQGRHNWQNAALAYAAARALGLDEATIVPALARFPGLAHRQFVTRTIEGIRYINDSKATNDDAAATALRAFASVYWIAGGLSKGSGYAACEKEIARVRHAFLIGAAAAEMSAWLGRNGTPHTVCHTLDAAVEAAHRMAQKERYADSVVLLSPACASFDQFRNFEDRGEAFARLVDGLPGPARGPL